MNKITDRAAGCLVAGGCGDALGYAVEFDSYQSICAKYGNHGIQNYDLTRTADGVECAIVSDDTQMTLYTAEGLIEAELSGAEILPTICQAYLAWYGGQMGRKIKGGYRSALTEIAELNVQRAPGNTCLTALHSIHSGRKPANSSKGCGGVMRVAPVGIYGAAQGWDLLRTVRLAGEAAELTHLHPLSTYSSAALAVIIQMSLLSEMVNLARFKLIIEQSLAVVKEAYGPEASDFATFETLIRKALNLAETDTSHPDWQMIENELGGGWVAEETLAIAVYSVARHLDDFKGCMICAVNHGGDSDSTGAMAGNIIGAIMGYDALPDEFTRPLQFRALLRRTATLLCKIPSTAATDHPRSSYDVIATDIKVYDLIDFGVEVKPERR